VGSPYWTTGRPVPIYGFYNATPDQVEEAQKRYGEIRRQALAIRRGPDQILEAVAIAKAYMDPRGLNVIPKRVILGPLLKEAKVKVDYSRFLRELTKEGYSWK